MKHKNSIVHGPLGHHERLLEIISSLGTRTTESCKTEGKGVGGRKFQMMGKKGEELDWQMEIS